jgi:hypothetical protein
MSLDKKFSFHSISKVLDHTKWAEQQQILTKWAGQSIPLKMDRKINSTQNGQENQLLRKWAFTLN